MRASRRSFLAGLLAVAACRGRDDDGTARRPSGGNGDGAPSRGASPAPSTTGLAAPLTVTPVAVPPGPELGPGPFGLGVASGDPLPDGVVLWTRVLPAPTADGVAVEVPDDDITLGWDVAVDEAFTAVVRSGLVTARAEDAHTVHVDADGLAPGTAYWYRFRTATAASPSGRTRTAPADHSVPERLVVAAASCQNYQHGHYVAHRDLAGDPPDVVVFLGDYIYETGVDGSGPRRHDGPAPTDLDGYRRRYAHYKADPDLRAAHQAAPWLVVWDDHEVENNYAGLLPSGAVPGTGPDPAFAERRAAAYRAWWEHQPVRLPPPTGPDLPAHRSFRWGKLAHLVLLDGRQHRDDQACGDGVGEACPELADPGRTMLGADQEAWLAEQFADARRAGAQWLLLGNQTALTDMTVRLGRNPLTLFDQWDGYPEARRRLLTAARRMGSPDLVALTGDLHATIVGTVVLDGEPVATEFVTPSISSRFAGDNGPTFELGMRLVPAVQLAETAHRGYLRCTVTPTEVRATYRWVEDAAIADAAVVSASTWVVRTGRPGAVPA